MVATRIVFGRRLGRDPVGWSKSMEPGCGGPILWQFLHWVRSVWSRATSMSGCPKRKAWTCVKVPRLRMRTCEAWRVRKAQMKRRGQVNHLSDQLHVTVLYMKAPVTASLLFVLDADTVDDQPPQRSPSLKLPHMRTAHLFTPTVAYTAL